MSRQFIVTLMLAGLLLIQTAPSHASIFGEENGWLAQMTAYLSDVYNNTKKALQEYKQANSTLTEVKDATKDALRDYDALQNIKATDWKAMVERDIEALTELDNMDGMTREQQLRTVLRELDRRIADPNTSEAEKKAAAEQKKLLLQQEEQAKLRAMCREALKKTAGSASERQLQQAQTQCQAAQAIAATTEAEARMNAQLAAEQDAETGAKMLGQSADAMNNMADAFEGK